MDNTDKITTMKDPDKLNVVAHDFDDNAVLTSVRDEVQVQTQKSPKGEKIALEAKISEKKPRSRNGKYEKEDISETHPILATISLRKAEKNNYIWSEAEIETVELKHHTFEEVPQSESIKKETNVVLSLPIQTTHGDAKRRKHFKKRKTKTNTNEEQMIDDHDTLDEIKDTSDEEGDKTMDIQENEKMIKPSKMLDTQNKSVTKVARKEKSATEVETAEQPKFGEIKLRKSSTVRREWESKELEQVRLKHHEFERPPEEQPVSTVCMDWLIMMLFH
jgi:hypothetical protein